MAEPEKGLALPPTDEEVPSTSPDGTSSGSGIEAVPNKGNHPGN
jgi:hypothetical protein